MVVVTTIAFSGYNYFSDGKIIKKTEIKQDVKKTEISKPKIKKPETKKEVKKPQIKKPDSIQEKKKTKEKPKLEVKRKNVDEVILPNLNLKTETVLNLFKDVEYDLGKVRAQKLVKPIYFTQFQGTLIRCKALN